MKSARLGVIGEHPVGLDSCHLDETALREAFGVEIKKIELADVFARARQVPASTLMNTRSLLDARLDNLSDLEQIPLNGTLSVYQALKEIAIEQELDGLAVRCWPEFFTELGCAACGAMSMLSDGFCHAAPIPCSCEADINGTLTQLILQWLSDSPAFRHGYGGSRPGKKPDRTLALRIGTLVFCQPISAAARRDPFQPPSTVGDGFCPQTRDGYRCPDQPIHRVFAPGRWQRRNAAEPKPFSGTAGILNLIVLHRISSTF